MDSERVGDMSQDAKQGSEPGSRLNRTQQVVTQGYPPPQQQHIAPAFEHLYCQCGCGAPIEAVVRMHTAAGAQHQAHRHHSQHHQSTFPGSSGGAGLMHPHMYAAPYPAQHEMAQQQLQSQIAAAAALNQYTTGYGRGLTELDPYRSTHMQYRPQMELPRGYTVLTPGAGTYLAPSPHLGYYRQYPGMMHVTASGGESRVRGASEHVPSAATSGTSPEAAPPPPPHANPTGPQQQGQQGNRQQAHPKESPLSSLMVTRSDRMSGAGADADMNSRDGPTASSAASHTTQAGPATMGGLHHQGTTTGPGGTVNGAGNTSAVTGGGPPSTMTSLGPHQHFATTSPLRSRETSGGSSGAGAAAAAAAAVTAATAMQFSGLQGGFPSGMHSLGGISGMAPSTMQVAVTMPGGPAPPPPSSMRMTPHPAAPDATVAMNAMQYMGAAVTAVAAAGAGVGATNNVGPVAMGFSSHETFEEQMRQQEKKQMKRAANRRSAQQSRKRKKALIEELKYENQDLQRHEDILEVIPDPVFAFDTANGSVWFASNSASAQFGLPVEDLTSSNFFDLMTEDCAKRLRVLIDAASKSISESGTTLLHERMTVRFKKRKAAILLGELSGRLSKQGDGITAVCSVRPLSLATEESVGKGYFGDASVSELAEDTSVDQGSSGEDSRSAHTGATSGSTAGSSSGLGTGCTSIADEGSSSVPSLSSLEVKRDGQGRGASSSSSVGGGPNGVGADRGGGGGSSSLNGSVGEENGSAGVGSGTSGSNGGSSNNGSEEGGAYSDSLSYGGVQDGFDEPVNTDSEGANTGVSGSGGSRRSRGGRNVVTERSAERSKRPEKSASSPTRSSAEDRDKGTEAGGVGSGDDVEGRRGSTKGKRKKKSGEDDDCDRDNHRGADNENNGAATPDSSSSSLSPSSSPSSTAARGSEPDAASEILPAGKRQCRKKVAAPPAPSRNKRDRIDGEKSVSRTANQQPFPAVCFSSEGVGKLRRPGATDSTALRIGGQVIPRVVPLPDMGESAMAARGAASGRCKKGDAERPKVRATSSSSRHDEPTDDDVS